MTVCIRYIVYTENIHILPLQLQIWLYKQYLQVYKIYPPPPFPQSIQYYLSCIYPSRVCASLRRQSRNVPIFIYICFFFVNFYKTFSLYFFVLSALLSIYPLAEWGRHSQWAFPRNSIYLYNPQQTHSVTRFTESPLVCEWGRECNVKCKSFLM